MEDAIDFSEGRYVELLERAASRFEICRLHEACEYQAACLWRHDIDVSPQRALKLAEIEATRGITAQYYVMLTSRFYNAFEERNASIFRHLRELGHDVGLHFDAASLRPGATSADVARTLRLQADVLGEVVGGRVELFSLHNPTDIESIVLDESEFAGMLNASSSTLRKNFTYCSDSNGVWRFRSLAEVIDDPVTERLYALTHPEWWCEQPLTPRDRIQRAIDGRATCTALDYDADLARFNRPNF